MHANTLVLDRVLKDLYGELKRSLEQGAGGPFAAAVLHRGEVIGTGTNTVLRDRDVSRHGEINALAAAGRAMGKVPLEDAELLTTHYPCLMCYHAAKWAGIRRIHFVFDYEETARLFGFHGDLRFLRDLRLSEDALAGDPTVELTRVESALVDSLYRQELVDLWESYSEALSGYDVD